MQWLLDHKSYFSTFSSCQDLGFSGRTIKACLAKNWLSEEISLPNPEAVALNSEQEQAKNSILTATTFQVFLLDGVTGSGKTEVYCAVINKIIASGKQALVLVPEIGLTKQTVERFVQRCGVQAVVIHSKITAQQKAARWQNISNGQAQLVIGTRSALFAPLRDLGIIIIDESHDASFKQQSTCCYSAKHTGIMLAKNLNIPIVLGTATPSLDSLHKTTIGSYKLLRLTQKQKIVAEPELNIIDSRGQAQESGIALKIKDKILTVLELGEQVLVFVNRRGYAPVLLCHACGYAESCSSCDTNMVFHNAPSELRCHICQKRQAAPERCCKCGAKSWLKLGLGTQKVEEVLTSWFPSRKITRLDSDSVKNTNEFNNAIKAINQSEAEIIIGTQMLAKGHDFNNIGLVVILDADTQLYNPDYKSQERLAQMLVQVAGRVGRRGKKGKIVLQTHSPSSNVFSVLKSGYGVWASNELAQRRRYELEPYIFSATFNIQAQKQASLDKIKSEFRQHVPLLDGVSVYGPVACFKPKRQGYWRDVVTIEAKNRSLINKQALMILNVSSKMQWGRYASLRFDVDPIFQD